MPNIARISVSEKSQDNPYLTPQQGDLVEVIYTAIDDDATQVVCPLCIAFIIIYVLLYIHICLCT